MNPAPSRNPDYVAHTPPEGDPRKWQSMNDHTARVADLAAGWADSFGAADLARWAAWLHDVGKYGEDFQAYLRQCDAARHGQGKTPKPGSAEHKIAGTRLALERLPPNVREVTAACVLGHHGGLNAFAQMREMIAKDPEQVRRQDQAIARALADFPALVGVPPAVLPPAAGATAWEREMLIRFVFSCLVDADGLDTERHFSPDTYAQRGRETLTALGPGWLETLRAAQAALQAGAEPTRVNEVRREVYEACLEASMLPPGLFSLTVPTGGGKTRSSLAFALAHALEHGRSRIIYAIPYTSIIDQIAAEFRRILGDDGVLEHHSAVEDRAERPERGTQEDPAAAQAEDARDQRRKLDAENWDAPLVVTTTVQLFESLFSNRTGRCRKLHSVAGSVLVLDEVQTLPPHLLTPLLNGLKTLLTHYGVTVVLCTATQPAITGQTPFLQELGPPRAIIPEDTMREHFRDLKRVTYRVEAEPWDWARVAEEIRTDPRSSLSVLNTKRDALALLRALGDPDARHLSTLLCGEHRRHVLDEVKAALAAERAGEGPPVRLISTQVIEAGVDIDFPRVLRAKGPLDRIIQAAGRCNREGRTGSLGDVTIFDPAEGRTPPGEYLTALQEAWMMISGGGVDFDDPDTATRFFTRFYGVLGPKGMDYPRPVTVNGVRSTEPVQDSRKCFDFPLVAQKMRLIADDTLPVLVPYHRGYHEGVFPQVKHSKDQYDALVEKIYDRQAAKKSLGRKLWRDVQSLTVAVRASELAKLPVSPAYQPDAPESLYVWKGTYDPIVGIGDSVDLDISDSIT